MSDFIILTINPGSTSTKISLFHNTKEQTLQNVEHSPELLKNSENLWDQLEFRLAAVHEFLSDNFSSNEKIDAVVGRGGLLHPIPGGVYLVNQQMLDDAKAGKQGHHASNLGCAMAQRIADEYECPAYIVDPVSTDETRPIAKFSGNPHIERRSMSHALNIHYIARKVAEEIENPLKHSTFVVAHLGGGFSIAAVKGGRIIDVNDANNEGPFSPARSGSLPTTSLAKWVIEKNFTNQEILNELLQNSGWVGYLGTIDGKEIDQRIQNGDEEAQQIVEAMAYQIGKEIAAMASVLDGEVNRIVLTGGLAKFEYLINLTVSRIKWIAPVEILPGEFEMQALAEGAYRALTGTETPLEY